MPTVRDVVAALAINPNTVLKAYRELEREGLIGSRPGQGTYVLAGIPGPAPGVMLVLRRSLDRWVGQAHAEGLDAEAILALLEDVLARSGDELTA